MTSYSTYDPLAAAAAAAGGEKVVVIGEQYCVPYTAELCVSSKTASSSFTITDTQGRVLFKVDARTFSLRDKHVILDSNDRPFACAQKAKLMSAHEKWDVYKGDNFKEESKLFRVQKPKAMQMKTHLEVLLVGNPSEDRPDFTIKGDYMERQVQIFQGNNRVIAEVKRKMSAGNVLLDKHTFNVVVWPNVDQAFIATLVVIMDEIQD